MATTKKNVKNELRAVWTEKVTEWLRTNGEDALRVSSNEIAIPVVGSDGNEDFVIFTVKVPIGSRDGEAYDGYAMAEDFKLKQDSKAAKAAEAAKAKEAKKARDEKAREEKRRAREAAKQAKENQPTETEEG